MAVDPETGNSQREFLEFLKKEAVRQEALVDRRLSLAEQHIGEVSKLLANKLVLINAGALVGLPAIFQISDVALSGAALGALPFFLLGLVLAVLALLAELMNAQKIQHFWEVKSDLVEHDLFAKHLPDHTNEELKERRSNLHSEAKLTNKQIRNWARCYNVLIIAAVSLFVLGAVQFVPLNEIWRDWAGSEISTVTETTE